MSTNTTDNIRIQLDHIVDKHGNLGVRLLNDDEKAEANQGLLDLDARLRDENDVIERVFTFKRPLVPDKMAIRQIAWDRASREGEVSTWILGQHICIAAAERLLIGIEDGEGKPVEGGIPDYLLESVAALLDTYITPSQGVKDFLSQSASRSPEETVSA